MLFSEDMDAFLREALPATTGGHALALREDHFQTAHLVALREAIPQLVADHNLGAIGFEFPAFMMLFDWACRDGKLGKTPEESQQLLARLHRGMITEGFAENSDAQSALIEAAHAHGVKVVFFDSRKEGLLHSAFNELGTQILAFQRKFPDGDVGNGEYLDDKDSTAWVMLQAMKLYNENPDYKARLDAIEGVMRVMQRSNIPADVVSATVMSELSDRRKNILTISGTRHLDGSQNKEFDVQGIFDDALAANGWKVKDTHWGSKQELDRLVQEDPLDLASCRVKSHLDAVYVTDLQRLLRLTEAADVVSCVNSPPVTKVYAPSQLHPLDEGRNPLLVELFHSMREVGEHLPSAPTPVGGSAIEKGLSSGR